MKTFFSPLQMIIIILFTLRSSQNVCDVLSFFLSTEIYVPVVAIPMNTNCVVSVVHSDAPSDWRPGDRGFNPRRDRQHSFVEIDHEIFSTVILSLPLIQERQLSVSGERMCTILVNRFVED